MKGRTNAVTLKSGITDLELSQWKEVNDRLENNVGTYDIAPQPDAPYQPNSDMVWAKNILINDTNYPEYTCKYISMLDDYAESNTFYINNKEVIITSDGQVYDNREGTATMTISHIWDDTNARTSENYNGRKLRWYIHYTIKPFYTNNTISISKPLKSSLYLCFSGHNDNNNNLLKIINLSFTSYYLLEYFDCINNISIKFYSPSTFFRDCRNLKSFGDNAIYSTGETDFSNTFRDVPSLEYLPYIDTSSGTNFNGFLNCKYLKGMAKLDFSKATNLTYAFSNCENIKEIKGIFNCNDCINFSYCFNRCYNIQYIDNIILNNNNNNINCSNMFYDCHKLKKSPINIKDYSKILNSYNMYNGCINLQDIGNGIIDLKNSTNYSSMFSNCTLLNNNIHIKSYTKNISPIFINTKIKSLIFEDLYEGNDIVDIAVFNALEYCSFIKTNITRARYFNCNSNYSLRKIEFAINTNIEKLSFDYGVENLIDMGTWDFSNYTQTEITIPDNVEKLKVLNVSKNINLFYTNINKNTFIQNIITGLVDLTGKPSQTIRINARLLSQLTDEEKALVTNKNWILR